MQNLLDLALKIATDINIFYHDMLQPIAGKGRNNLINYVLSRWE